MTGAELLQSIQVPPPLPPPLVEHFLYERCVMLITGETGKGKSVIGAQLALSLATGTPLFGQLLISQPRRVYFIQAEGSRPEQFRRLHFMQQSVPLSPLTASNLFWDAEKMTRLDTFSPRSVSLTLKKIEHAFPQGLDALIIDPIYKVMGGDPAKADIALSFVHFSDLVMNAFGCSVVLFHHPHREKLDIRGKKIEEDDAYYGHSFIKNHIEVSYFFKQTATDGYTSQLILKKRREDNVLTPIDLRYHPETYSCSMLPIDHTISKRDQIGAHLHQLATSHQSTTFKEVRDHFGISVSFLRELQADYRRQGLIQFIARPGKDTIWYPLLASNQPENLPENGTVSA